MAIIKTVDAAAASGGGDGAGSDPTSPMMSSPIAKTKTNPYVANMSRSSPATVAWLHENFEACEDISLGREPLYNYYVEHCGVLGTDPVNQASFGKLIRSVFPKLKTRRLGTRGNSKYHYYGIRLTESSKLVFLPAQIGGPHHRYRGRGGGEKAKYKKSKAKESKGKDKINMALYIDTSATVPAFLPMNTAEGQDFAEPYHAHCSSILSTVCSGNFLAIQEIMNQFWGSLAAHFIPYLCSQAGIEAVIGCDRVFFSCLQRAMATNLLTPMPAQLARQIRNFSRCLDSWTKTALIAFPDLAACKGELNGQLAHVLRRYTSLNHLAGAARPVLASREQTDQMLADIMCLDFAEIGAQSRLVCHCPADWATARVDEFKLGLAEPYTLEQWTAWLQRTLKAYIKLAGPDLDADAAAAQARHFLPRWSFYSSMVIRDVTLRSSESFGSFSLLSLLLDEYIMHLVESVAVEGMEVLDRPVSSHSLAIEQPPPAPKAPAAEAVVAPPAAASVSVAAVAPGGPGGL